MLSTPLSSSPLAQEEEIESSQMPHVKRKKITEWKREQILTGADQTNPNFAPVGVRPARQGAAALLQTPAVQPAE